MPPSITNSVVRVFSLSWLTGPILEKELRVSSRRRRNYLLRSAYLLFLTVFVAYVWFVAVTINSNSSASYRISRMSVAATSITTTIAWFQFIALQLTALVMLSNSINDEVRKKTLDVLISTPITSLQIVMGKLTSKLLQLMLLLAVSLPLLAVVRAFGGVPWYYLAASLCVTVTATIFAASLSLLLSTMRTNAYTAITSSISMAIVLFGGLPAFASLMFFLTKNTFFQEILLPATLIVNPFAAMIYLSESMFSSRTAGSLAGYSWPVHCMLMFTFSSVLLVISVFRIRPAVLNRDKKSLAWRLGRKCRKFVRKNKAASIGTSVDSPACRITGDPILWRELNRPLTGSMFSDRAGLVIVAAILIVAYGLAIYYKWIIEKGFHSVFVGLLALVILMRTATLAATAIASEKQTKAWPILLTTPLEDAHIIRSKALAVFRRTLWLWIILTVHIAFFIIIGVLHPLAAVGAFYSIAPGVLFLIGSGMVAGTFFRTNTGAIVATFTIPVLGWFFCPCLSFSNPVLTAGWSMQANSNLFFDAASIISPFAFLGLLTFALPAIAYSGFGMFFLFLAKRRLRRNIFV